MMTLPIKFSSLMGLNLLFLKTKINSYSKNRLF